MFQRSYQNRSKNLAENFILALSRQTWLGIIRDNDALIGNVSETESSSETTKYVPEDSLEAKVIVMKMMKISLFLT